MMTVAQVAELSGLHRAHVRRVLAAGKIPGAVKIAAVWFVPADAARSWVQVRAERKAARRRRRK